MSNPKRQHWVPRFYLKYFATPETQNTDNPQVWIFSKDDSDGPPKQTSITNICTKNYLYTPTNEEEQREWAFESKLSELESGIGSVWSVLTDDYVDLHKEEGLRKGVALFVSVMHLRNPDVLLETKDAHARIVQTVDRLPKQNDGTPDINAVTINGKIHQVDPTGWHEYKNWTKNDHDKFFISFIQSYAIKLAEVLLTKRWSVLFCDQPVFITSDKPVSLQNTDKKTYGFNSEGTTITFPLSPSRLLVMDDMHNEPKGQYYRLEKQFAGESNFLIWRESNRFMISHRNIDEVLTEIDDCVNRHKAMKPQE